MSSAPNSSFGSSFSLTGPEMGILGRFQACPSSLNLATFLMSVGAGDDRREGGPPIMAPSMKWHVLGLKRVEILRAELGEIALRSR